jgi:hypothetical protein
MSRRIATFFIMFAIGSYAASYAKGFWPTICKGTVLGAIIFPPIYMHYSDEEKYYFQYSKRD